MEKLKSKKPIIGIVGGTGKMGTLFVKFFRKNGFKVLISSRKTVLTNIELAKKSDIVIVSVPLAITIEIINEIAPFVKKDALFTDFSAVKQAPVKAMLKSKASVVGMHPVFGPMVKSFNNQTVVLCPARGRKWFLWLKNLLVKSGFRVKVSTPKEHDTMMAVIQGLTHFTTISLGYALKSLKVDIKKSLEFLSPSYKLIIDTTGRILAQDPEVYTDISFYNEYIKDIIYGYQKSADKILKSIYNEDKKNFRKIFKESSDYLGDYKYKSLEETNYLIEKLARMK